MLSDRMVLVPEIIAPASGLANAAPVAVMVLIEFKVSFDSLAPFMPAEKRLKNVPQFSSDKFIALSK